MVEYFKYNYSWSAYLFKKVSLRVTNMDRSYFNNIIGDMCNNNMEYDNKKKINSF